MQYTNLVDIFQARKSSQDKGVTFIEGSGREEFVSYAELNFSALKVLSFLRNAGLRPKDELVFQINNNKNFLYAFWACILGGIVPVPLSIGHNDDHKQKLFSVWPFLNNPYLITSRSNLHTLRTFSNQRGLASEFTKFDNRYIEETNILSSQQEGTVFAAKENDI